MTTPRRAVELELEEWKIEEQGFTEAPYIVRFELLWPRPGIENVKSVLPLPDRIGETVDWSEEELIKKWIFKEDMEGRMILSASVVPLDPEASGSDLQEDALDFLGRSVARQSSVTWGTLSDLIDLGSGMANYVLSGPQKAIAEGNIVIDKQENTTLELPLVAPNKLENPQPDPTPEDHRPTDDHQDVLKSVGDDNGYMNIKMTVWEE